MPDYTPDEITTAVEQIVRSSIRRPYGALGNRDIQTSFNDLQDAAAGVFLLEQNAPFYVAFLGAQRLKEYIENELSILLELIEAIENTDRKTKDINNLASLNNARTALTSLEIASNSRTNSFQSIEDVPAFKRYDANLQRFLDEHGNNIRKNNQIVPTPQESRIKLPQLIRDLKAAHAEVISRLQYLAGAIDNYDSLNLPSIISTGVISRARQVLSSRVDELEVLSPKDRLAKIRETILDLLAGRAAVKAMGSLKATTIFALLEGNADVFADVDHPATPARLVSDIAGPYPIIAGENELYFRMDDSFSFTGIVPGSYVANLTGRAEPYEFTADNNILWVDIDGFDRLIITFSLAQLTALQVADAIDLQIANQIPVLPANYPLIAEQIIFQRRFVGSVNIIVPSIHGGDADILISPDFPGNWGNLGIQPGDSLTVSDFTSANNGLWFTVLSIEEDETILTVAKDTEAPVEETSKNVEVGPARAVRLRIKDSEAINCLNNRVSFSFPASYANTALESLGFPVGGVIRCRSTDADTIVGSLLTSYASQKQGIPRLGAQAVLETVYDGPGRSNPEDATQVVAYKVRAAGTVTGGSNVVFSILASQLANIEVGDVIVIRETTTLADLNVAGVITEVVTDPSDPHISATMVQAIADGNILCEVMDGSSLPVLPKYLDFRISDSAGQDGDYTLVYSGIQVFSGITTNVRSEFNLERTIPLNRAQGGLPQLFNLEIGLKKIAFSSTDTSLATKVKLDESGGFNSAVRKFINSGIQEEVGTTKYFQLPEDPKNLSEGDILELHETSPSVPTYNPTITSLEMTNLLVEVNPELPTDLSEVNMSLNSSVPFGRVRLVKKNNYSVLKDGIDDWLTWDENLDSWFINLYRYTNPLVSNLNPTIYHVNTAKLHVQALYETLQDLQLIIDAYSVLPVEPIDNLITTYLDKGCDRGVDVLLQGRFSEFFGFTAEQMSYVGQMQSTIREVASNDLPVRKTNRLNNPNEQIEASWAGINYDIDSSDTIDPDENINIPGAFNDIPPSGI